LCQGAEIVCNVLRTRAKAIDAVAKDEYQLCSGWEPHKELPGISQRMPQGLRKNSRIRVNQEEDIARGLKPGFLLSLLRHD
jgi:hypothetical protein